MFPNLKWHGKQQINVNVKDPHLSTSSLCISMMRLASSSGSLIKSISIGSLSLGAVEELARSVPIMDLPSVLRLRFGGLGLGLVLGTGVAT